MKKEKHSCQKSNFEYFRENCWNRVCLPLLVPLLTIAAFLLVVLLVCL